MFDVIKLNETKQRAAVQKDKKSKLLSCLFLWSKVKTNERLFCTRQACLTTTWEQTGYNRADLLLSDH